jgi:hypothetical protein
MMTIIEAFIDRTFILGFAARKLKASVQAKPQRMKKERLDEIGHQKNYWWII